MTVTLFFARHLSNLEDLSRIKYRHLLSFILYLEDIS